jgi:hypothetical protein
LNGLPRQTEKVVLGQMISFARPVLAFIALSVLALANQSSASAHGFSATTNFGASAHTGTGRVSPENCHITAVVSAFETCTYGPKHPTYRVALTGDSHAMQYQQPVLALVKKYGWSVTFVLKSGCPLVDVALFPANMNRPSCKWWSIKRDAFFASRKPFDLVINSNSSLITRFKTGIAASFAAAVKRFTDRNSEFLLIRDNPKGIPGVEVCSANKSKLDAGQCDSPKHKALMPSDPLPEAVMSNSRVIIGDFTDVYCDATTCYASRFSQNVYRNRSHINNSWAMNLLSRFDALIPAELKHPKR